MSASKSFPQMAKNAWASAQPGDNPGAGPEVSSDKDSQLHESFHNRTYNPLDSAKRGNVSGELNSDAARYKKGPGPL